MQFALIGYDGTDDEALQRRLAVRERHLALSEEMARDGRLLYGAAILDDAGKMIGSMCFYEFPSRQDLDAYLETEPYVVGKVWQRIEIRPCKTAPVFSK